MKAIETVYKGYRFRSRLEARWAVFFDAIGVKWDYEKEGYVLNSGAHYLPDFIAYTEEFGDIFIEIKPERTPLADEVSKCIELNQQSRKKVILVSGAPVVGKTWRDESCVEVPHALFIDGQEQPEWNKFNQWLSECDPKHAVDAFYGARFEHGMKGYEPKPAVVEFIPVRQVVQPLTVLHSDGKAKRNALLEIEALQKAEAAMPIASAPMWRPMAAA